VTAARLSFAITWDYRCPYARNAHEHVVAGLLAGAPWDVTFIPFNLDQTHIGEGGVPVWDEPDRYPGLLATAAGVVVRDLFPDRFLAAHVGLFAARHDLSLDLRQRDILAGVLADAGVDADAVLAAMIEADRAAVAGLTVPEDFRVGLDLTDSGPLPTTARGWDPTAFETLIDATPFHRLSLDFPADPAARLPLDLVKPGLVISLGVVDVSSPELETVESLLDLVDPIVEERGEYDVAIATNGGFAQSADHPLMTQAEQNEKLRLVEMVARYYWGNEI
jgi:hypothetical protein